MEQLLGGNVTELMEEEDKFVTTMIDKISVKYSGLDETKKSFPLNWLLGRIPKSGWKKQLMEVGDDAKMRFVIELDGGIKHNLVLDKDDSIRYHLYTPDNYAFPEDTLVSLNANEKNCTVELSKRNELGYLERRVFSKIQMTSSQSL